MRSTSFLSRLQLGLKIYPLEREMYERKAGRATNARGGLGFMTSGRKARKPEKRTNWRKWRIERRERSKGRGSKEGREGVAGGIIGN